MDLQSTTNPAVSFASAAQGLKSLGLTKSLTAAMAA
jgi:hypothetical protein